MAEGLLRRLIAARQLPARVISAGLYPSGNPATPDAVAVMEERGIDISGHRSRQIDRALVEQADLVVAMTREHVREVAVLDPKLLDKTFTLKELVVLAATAAPRRSSESVGAWLARLAKGRRRDALLGVGHDPQLDVEDPIGTTIERYRDTADDLEVLLRELVDQTWPEHRPEREPQERSA
jgi:protein-tyrosine phosphatase